MSFLDSTCQRDLRDSANLLAPAHIQQKHLWWRRSMLLRFYTLARSCHGEHPNELVLDLAGQHAIQARI